MEGGDGKSINIWEHLWVPRSTDFHYRGTQNSSITRVSQLIREGRWDVQEVIRVIGAPDAQLILSIPLSRHEIMDRLVWNHTKSGSYLTCSGYKRACDVKRNGDLGGRARGGGSLARGPDGLWKHLWGLKIPPRFQNFLWRCLQNILPMKDKLIKRRMQVHSFGSLLLGILTQLGDLGRHSENGGIIYITTQLREWDCEELIAHLACVLWCLWKLRNSRVFKTREEDCATLFKRGTAMVLDYLEANMTFTTPRMEAVTAGLGREETRVCPVATTKKINVDAGWNAKSNQGFVGVIVRDDQGDYV
ncbi:hypothetical protein LIER_23885 [Lithospermum erythrorhizon]|uniref:Reverse transcriptase zinc-binding domain-containing protein n=1 Tax=Lithospermum erythrorhizon TaxID=34254 RepID=A0AAV3R322_LITER